MLIERYRQKKQEKNLLCDKYLNILKQSIYEVEILFKNEQEYIDMLFNQEWNDKYNPILSEIEKLPIKKLKKTKNFKNLLYTSNKVNKIKHTLKLKIEEHNLKIVKKKKQEAKKILGLVEGKDLDDQQIESIIKEAHNQLVLAGAGTGKTTTIVGKVKYLVKTNRYNPNEILLLSFTHDSATELSKRVYKELQIEFEASTFHKLGLSIIAKVTGEKPNITKINLYRFIKEQLDELLKDTNYNKIFMNYIIYHSIPNKTEFEFNTINEYKEYLKNYPPITIDKTEVKSYGEMDIGNYLFQNNIKYEYEKSYQYNTADELHAQYRPDFYLPDYDIYIEYFGIDRNGNVPKFFTSKIDTTATEEYQKSMKWKRELHQKQGTTMIECYAYEKQEGTLVENLKKKLIDKKVQIVPKTDDEIWSTLQNEKSKIYDGIIRLLETVINLIKNNGYTINQIKEKCQDSIDNKELVNLLEPIYINYNRVLKSNNEIDFNDMINLASQYIKDKKYENPFKCVIIDEYQDLSLSRYNLLKNLRDSNDYELFCVGDDWQSIYRFAGSDIGFTINFEKYWGPTEFSKIETTYRFGQILSQISSNFIMENPKQIQKQIIGLNIEKGFPLGEIQGYQEQYAIQFMIDKLSDLPPKSTIFMIGRYKFDIEMLKNTDFQIRYDNITNTHTILYPPRKDLKIEFLTAHKSKGLQADYVFILNNKNSRIGFPSNIQESSILSLLLDNCDSYPYAEERRLFYVAMTRAKKKIYTITEKEKESIFIRELKNKYGREIDNEAYECPLCGGRLTKRNGRYGEFFGCSNYNINGCKYTRKIKKATYKEQ